MYRFILLAPLALATSALAGPPASGTISQFTTMYGVDGPFMGDANKIRGLEGDELPWIVAKAAGTLTDDGHLHITVHGLVFADDPAVPPPLRLHNDETEFRGVVSCLVESADETSVQTVNVVTAGYPATRRGDSTIDEMIVLPDECVAPLIFVIAGSEDKWFSVTGG